MVEIEFGTYEETPKSNEYDSVVQDLADRGANAKIVLTIPVEDVQREQFKFQRAANGINRTAKVKDKDESGVKDSKPDKDGNVIREGNVKLTFILVEKHKARSQAKRAGNNTASVPTPVDAA